MSRGHEVKSIRVADRLASAPEAVSGCGERGCREATSLGKPFCSTHLAAMPYVARLVAEIESRALAAQRAQVGVRPVKVAAVGSGKLKIAV